VAKLPTRKVTGRGPAGIIHYAPVKPKKPVKPAPSGQKTDPYLSALAPLTQAQIAAKAKNEVYPAANAQIAALTNELTRTSKAGAGAISGYANQLANDLGGYGASAKQIYGGAQQSQAAVDAALASRLTGQGNQLGDELAAKLAQINAPGAQMSDVAGGARQIGQTSGNTQFALGSNELGRLVGEGAASQNYAAKQPGIARMGGLAAGRDLELQLQKQLADKSGEIRAQAASDYASAVKGYSADEVDKAIANLTQRGKVAVADVGAQADAAKLHATAAEKERDRESKIQLKREEIASRERIAAGNREAAATKASQAAATKATDKAEAAQKAATAKKEAEQKVRTTAFYAARTSAVKDAQTAFAAGHTAAEVTAYLRSAYGKLLLGRGFSQAAVDQMIANAVKAGKVNPQAKGNAKPTSGPGGVYGGTGSGPVNPNR
jgi:hypothetical protein